MFRKPFDWRTRRNFLEAVGFYLIYVALGAAAEIHAQIVVCGLVGR